MQKKRINKLPRLTIDHNIKANKTFLYKTTTNLSTLGCHYFNVDNYEAENSTFMISIDKKVPQDIFLKWKDYKSKLKTNKKKVTSGAFTTFFGEKIRKEENANFFRRKPDNEGKSRNDKTCVKCNKRLSRKNKMEKRADTIRCTQTAVNHTILLK